MQIDWWTLALQTVNALVLVWLLARFLFRPVAKIVAERQKAAAALMADAAKAKADALAQRQAAADEAARTCGTAWRRAVGGSGGSGEAQVLARRSRSRRRRTASRSGRGRDRKARHAAR